MFGRCYWTCNIQTIRSYRTFGLSNSDIVLIPNTPYKTLHRMNCMYQHHRLNTMMWNHSLPYVRPYTDQRHKLTELSCSLLQYIYPQIRLFGIATRMFYRLLYLQYNCPDNCSEHHRCNMLHPCIVIDWYSYCHYCCIRLYSIRWIPFCKTTDPSNFDTLFAHCTHCTMQTPECHCRLYTYRRHKPTIPHIQYHLR